MSDEKQTTDAPAATEVKEQNKTNEPEKTISVDIFGEAVEMPLSKAKAIIAKRDTKTKEYNELKTKIVTAENQAKAEAERATLLELMKKQDTQAVEEAVGAKYRDTISRFERKVFDGEIKSALAKHGCLPDALGDASKLVIADAKPELDGDVVKLNGVAVEDYVKGWIEKKPHLVAVKATGRKETPAQPVKDTGFEKFASGLFNKK